MPWPCSSSELTIWPPEPAEKIVQAVLEAAETFGAQPADDRTLLVLRI